MPKPVLITERYTTVEGATVINQFCYIYAGGALCRLNSNGEIVQRVCYMACPSDVQLARAACDWHRANVTHPGCGLSWEFVHFWRNI